MTPPRSLSDVTPAEWEQALRWRQAMVDRVRVAEANVQEAIAGAPISLERVIAEKGLREIRRCREELEANVRVASARLAHVTMREGRDGR